MKQFIITFLFLIQVTPVLADNSLLVTARNGLNIRSQTDLSAEKLGKFNYAEEVKVIEKTGDSFKITDNGKKITGEWYKVFGKSSENEDISGYVFSGFLSKPAQKDTFTLLHYNDESDYTGLYAAKENSLYSFVNDDNQNDNRSYLRGDILEIEWKAKPIYIAGDGGTKEISDWVITTRKIKDGNLSRFRKNYKQKIKLYSLTDTSYSSEALKRLYFLVEYYIANTENALIKQRIQNKQTLQYSIGTEKRNNKHYTALGIAYPMGDEVKTVQWVYLDLNDPGELHLYDQLYEYTPSSDTLTPFKKDLK